MKRAIKPTIHLLLKDAAQVSESIGLKRPHINIVQICLDSQDKFSTSKDQDELYKAEILLGDPGLLSKLKMVQDLPNLKWMQSCIAGVEKLMKSLDHSKPLPSYKLTRFGGAFGVHMAEYVTGFIISQEKKFDIMKRNQARKVWDPKAVCGYRLLSSLRLGVIGCGDIGSEIAKAVSIFNMETWGVVKRNIPNRSKFVQKYLLMSSLPELLSNCDYICNVLPSTQETKDLLSGDILKHCEAKKPVFINVGRGDVIDESSIIKALSAGWISHAVLDVVYTEPLPNSSQLWDHPNVTITPHVSGVTNINELTDTFLENLDNFLDGKSMKYLVDFECEY